MHQRRHSIISTDHLWPLAALVMVGCLGCLIPVDQVDFWWHVALGRDIARLGAVPTTASQSWALPAGTPFTYGSWLAELALYGLHTLGGLPLIVLVRNLLLLSALGLVGVEARRRSGSWRIGALAIGGAGLMALNNISVRPQMFAWVLLTLTALVVGAYRKRQVGPRWLLLVPLLIALWVNLHGTFTLGLGIVGLAAVGETLTAMLRRPQRLTPREIGWLWGMTGLALGATLLNPRGIGIVGFVGALVSDPVVRQFVGEWQRPDLLSFPGIFVPLTLVLAGLGWLRSPRRFDLTDAGLLLAFGWLAASSMRNVIWFGMLAWPIAAGLLARDPGRVPRSRRQLPLVNYSLAAALLVPLVLVQPPLKAALALGPPFTGLGPEVADGIYISAGTPVRAVAWLKAHPLPPGARLFHDMEYGSYLMWALPEQQVFVDGRIELYPYATWLRYRQIVAGEGSLPELQALGATHALLSRGGQRDLLGLMAAPGSGWHAIYSDDVAVVYARSGAGGAR